VDLEGHSVPNFLGGSCAIEQRQFRIAPSKRIAWHEPGGPDQSRIPMMTADLILESPERRIVMDTKFYRSSFGGRGGGKLHSDNLYQLRTYLENRESGGQCTKACFSIPPSTWTSESTLTWDHKT